MSDRHSQQARRSSSAHSLSGGGRNSDGSLVPGCEIVSKQELLRRDYHFKRKLFLYETTNGGAPAAGQKAKKIWPLERGIIGTGPHSSVLLPRTELVQESHAGVIWRSDAGEYDLRDLGTSSGTYLVLSCSRPSRESIRLQTGDVFYLEKAQLGKKSRVSSAVHGHTPFQHRDQLSFEDYVKIRVNHVSPELPQAYPEKKDGMSTANSSNNAESPADAKKAFTMRRDSDFGVQQSLTSLKMQDIDIEKLRQGFKQAAEGYDASTNRGALIMDDNKNDNTGRQVVFKNVVEFDTSKVNKLRRNTFGGANILEQEATLDAIFSDDNITENELEVIEKAARFDGVPLSSANGQDDMLSAGNDGEDSGKGSVGNDRRGSTAAARRAKLSIRALETGVSYDNCGIELEVLSGSEKHKGNIFRFGLEDISLGSHSKNQIVIDGICSFHVRIERDANNYFWLKDMSMGHMNGTLLEISGQRQITVLKNDAIRFGPAFEVTAYEVPDHPSLVTEMWDCIGLEVQKTRYSLRYRQLVGDMGYMFKPKYFIMSSHEEMLIGRKVQECDIAVQDYEMPAFAAVINRFDNRYYISMIKEAKKKGVFLELSDRRGSDHTISGKVNNPIGKVHALQKGDTFRVGRSQMTVLLKHCESERAIQDRVTSYIDIISNVKLFSNLDREEITLLANHACAANFESGEIVIRQGEQVNGVFVIAEGSAEVFHEHCPKQVMATVFEGNILGEMGLFTGFPASASIRASGRVKCLYIDYSVAKAIIHPTNFEVMRLLIEHRVTQSHVYDLQQVSKLAKCDPSLLLALSTRMFRVILRKGSTLVTKGAPHDTMYIVGIGTVYKSYDQSESKADLIRPLAKRNSFTPIYGGGCIFEEVLSSPEHELFLAPYSVSAADVVVLYGLHRKDFHEVCKKNSDELQAEATKASSRLEDVYRGMTVAARSRPASVASSVISNTDSVKGMQREIVQIDASSPKTSSRQLTGESAKVAPEDVFSGTNENNSGKKPGFSFNLTSFKDATRRSSHSSPRQGTRTDSASYKFEPSHQGRFRSKRTSVSEEEGSEGEAFIRAQKLNSASKFQSMKSNKSVSMSGNEMGKYQSFSPRSKHSQDGGNVGSPMGASEFTKEDDATTFLSEGEEDDFDVTDYEYDDDDDAADDEMDAALFSRRTDLEKEFYHLSPAEMEKQLKQRLSNFIVLKCIMGPQKRQLFIITESVTVIGRWRSKKRYRQDEENPYPGRRFMSLNDRTVSRVNSTIQYRNGDYYLNDLGSKYGTHLKMKLNVDYRLEIGDVITCSQHQFTVCGKTRLIPKSSGAVCCNIL